MGGLEQLFTEFLKFVILHALQIHNSTLLYLHLKRLFLRYTLTRVNQLTVPGAERHTPPIGSG